MPHLMADMRPPQNPKALHEFVTESNSVNICGYQIAILRFMPPEKVKKGCLAVIRLVSSLPTCGKNAYCSTAKPA